MSGSPSNLPRVATLLEERFGRRVKCKGRYFYAMGYRFEGGAAVYFNEAGESMHFTAEVPGSALSMLTSDERYALLVDLHLARMKVTRIDVAIDFEGEGLGLIDAMIRSCEAGELCGARVFEPRRKVSGRSVTGRGVTIGQRGKLGSGRYIRCYDKGLEQQACGPREWERFEVEFTDEAAMELGDRLAEVGLDAWAHEGVNAALGAIDFREVTGRRELNKRPRCAWWAEILEGNEPYRVKKSREATNLQRWSRWVRKAVAPTMAAMMREGGVGVIEFWNQIAAELEPSAEARVRPVVWEYVQELVKRQALESEVA